ncbi:pleckstrin homology domain-containing family G member 7 isoform X2 [Danio rerio]|uniref:Pleckstrin homology domain-containing family G member 7 isoform X2 n=1 Tax=Danio rerio TaxID=7955 RepID=A0A8M3AUT4_DANRE|nr:pleckstrin homology domain-containing family G member 7 isoform X1 [Danio rerio]|eukprot:XP_009291782.1 pleckstrin homology domain-containing family G member 7 isoform X1 [Danio rerio]
MTELNYAFISENRKEVDKSLDWSYIDWHDKKMVKGTDAQTQTQHVHSKDIDTQTTNPCTMRINFDSTSSGMKLGSVTTSNCTSGDLITQEIHRHSPAPISPSQTQRRMPLPLHTPNFHRHSPACCSTSPALWRSSGMSYSVDFHRHSPTRISTSPTLRRMRSTRIYNRETSNPAKPLREESSTPMSPHSSFFREKSPLAADEENKSPESSVTPGTVRTHRSQTLDNGSICKSKESCDSKKPASDKESTTDDNEQVKDPCHKRLKERRRSSVVVSLPGLDVSPGDLFVSNGAADMLNKSDYSEKKSKWPFSRRSTTKVKTRSGADIDKCLASVQVPEWRDTDFQTFKDMSLVDFLQGRSELKAAQHPMTYKTQEAIWELFTSECVYFLDQLMVLKEVFLTTLSDLQTRQCLQDIDSWRLFANLNELCLVSFGFLTSLLRVIKEMWTDPDSCSTQSLHDLFRKAFSESICHCLQKYCLNYSTAILYLDSLKLREDFGSFVKWCERNEECRRLQLKDLLVVPLQRFTRYPLLLKNIGKRSCSKAEENTIQSIVDLVDRAIYDLEGKVKWLDNYQKVKQLKETLVWLPVWESDKRAHVPESLKHLLKPVTLENLVINRSLLHDGKLFLIENTKQQEVYLFLFDEFLLITKIKRNKKQKSGVVDFAAGQELELLLQEGCSFTVLDQPISLDRLQLKNIDQLNATASTLPNSFIIMHQNRYQQCIAVFVLQAQSESTKKAWMSEIEKAVSSLLKQDSLHPRVNNSFHYTESSQI